MQRYTFVFRSRRGDIEWALIQPCESDDAARTAARQLLFLVSWPVIDVRQSSREIVWYERCRGDSIGPDEG